MSDIKREIAGLRTLNRSALSARWRSVFGRDPPARLSRPLMQKAIAYEMQVKAFGGLSRRSTRILKAAAKRRDGNALPLRPGKGTRLVREWNGVLHAVDVMDDGYLWQGQRYRSLSAIAAAITGTKWSGPRFFGLKGE